ncbi:MAG TPA: septal ring lytic transglycosylase RlpA family lipoprotein, partial [Chitinophagaceae bacterium]|nr:septal ring lytic transglycosylase RlpA family lipoprotein [Chitinophagaceae bacterium]
AASNHFKLNTLVRVTNLKNNKSVIVLINDRMHNKMKRKGRVVDLTKHAAKELDFVKSGLTKVSVQPLIPYTKKQMGISSE